MTLDRGDSPLAGRRPAPLSSVAGLGAMNSIGTMGAGVSSGTVPGSATSLGSFGQLSSIGPLSAGGSGTNNSNANSGKSNSGQTPTFESRNSASFWLELKGVERWFDGLEPQERMTLMTSLFARTPESQLHQFEATIDKALRNQPSPSANLSRFGVRHNHSQAGAGTGGDISSVYKYRVPLSAGTNTNTGTSPSAQSSMSHVNNAHSNKKGVSMAPASANVPQTASGTVPPRSASAAGKQSDAQASGFVSPLSFSASSSHASDLYTQAFLPLPRTQSYSPWGTEIRRPSSAAADAWTDTARNSPTLKSVSNTGSPNISSLSLDTPSSFNAAPVPAPPASASSVQSPIGHPLKPWRTFTPHQNPIGSGIGQAPDSSNINRSSAVSHSSPPSPPVSAIGSRPTPVGSSTVVGGSTALTGQVTSPNAIYSSGSSSANPASSNVEETGSSSNVGSSNITASFNNGGITSNFGTPALANSTASRSGSVTPKDNRIARRSVNVVDVELLSDIGAWLRSLRLHKYTGNLSGMRWQDVIHLSDKDLEIRGVNALGARRKLLKMFEEIRIAQEAGQLPEV